MTTKLQKFLAQLTKAEKRVVDRTIDQVTSGDVTGLQIVKLKGSTNIYRVRKGRIRIIYRSLENKEVEIVQVSRRDDKTYRDF